MQCSWPSFALFCLLSTGSLCSGPYTLNYKAATILDVATSQHYALPSTGKSQSHWQTRRLGQMLFHWQFKLIGNANGSGSSKAHASLSCPCRLTVISSRTVRWTAVSMNIQNHGSYIWQSLSVKDPWLKGWLAVQSLQAGVCWREALESSGPKNLSKQQAAAKEWK